MNQIEARRVVGAIGTLCGGNSQVVLETPATQTEDGLPIEADYTIGCKVVKGQDKRCFLFSGGKCPKKVTTRNMRLDPVLNKYILNIF